MDTAAECGTGALQRWSISRCLARRLRSPYAEESSNCEKPSRLTSEHTTIVVLKNAEPWGFAFPLQSLALFVACSKVQTHTKET